MKEWKSIATDGYPEIGKPLWYFFEYVGVHFGKYYGADTMKYDDDEGIEREYFIHYFYFFLFFGWSFDYLWS